MIDLSDDYEEEYVPTPEEEKEISEYREEIITDLQFLDRDSPRMNFDVHELDDPVKFHMVILNRISRTDWNNKLKEMDRRLTIRIRGHKMEANLVPSRK